MADVAAPQDGYLLVDIPERPLLLAALHAVAERPGAWSGYDRSSPLSVQSAAAALDRGEPVIAHLNGRALHLGFPDRERVHTSRYDSVSADGLPLAAVVRSHLTAVDHKTVDAFIEDADGPRLLAEWAREILMLVNPARGWRVELLDGVQPAETLVDFPDEYRMLRAAYVGADQLQRISGIDPVDAFARNSWMITHAIDDRITREDADRLFSVSRSFIAGTLAEAGDDLAVRVHAWRQLPRLITTRTLRDLALMALGEPATIETEVGWKFD